ncbi:MAG: hypothetical protein WBQ58_03300, partial [Methanoregula sp.]
TQTTQTPTPAFTIPPIVPIPRINLGKILFTEVVGTGTDGTKIFVMNADGTGKTQLTMQGYSDRDPKWSPDGKKIVYVHWSVWGQSSSSDGIYVMNADGSGQTQLININYGDTWVAWSPDGTKIAFSYHGFEVMNPDGSDQTTLNSITFSDLSWSPDGKFIVFSSSQIGLMNADGTGIRQLTFPIGKNNDPDSDPQWSPDGTKIAFSRFGKGIFVMNPDGSDQTLISNCNVNCGGPVWSPDGKKIAYNNAVIFNNPSLGEYNVVKNQIWLMNSDGSDPTNITPNDISIGDKAISDWV